MSKIKTTAVLLAASLLLGGCAGGQKEAETSEITKAAVTTVNESPKNTENDNFYEENTVTESLKDQSYESETEAEAETVQEGPVYCDLQIDGIGNFVDGYSLLEKQKGGFAFIDESGKVYADITEGTFHDHVKRLNNNTVCFIDKLYDLNGNIIISPEMQGFDSISYVSDDYLFVYKKDSGFDGDVYYFGVLDTSGNWVQPLSSKLDIFKYEIKFPQNTPYVNSDKGDFVMIMTEEYQYTTGATKENKILLYDFINDKVVYEFYDSNIFLREDISAWKESKIINNAFYHHVDHGSGYVRYDFSTKKESVLFSDIRIDAVFNEAILTSDKKLCDYDGNVIIDLNDYDLAKPSENLFYKGGYATFIAAGKDSGYYLCCVNQKGEKVFDPIKVSDRKEFYDIKELYGSDRVLDYFSVEDSCIVYQFKGEKSFNIIDYNGNIKEIPIEKKLVGYDPGTGIYWCGTFNYGYCVDFYNSDGELIIKLNT